MEDIFFFFFIALPFAALMIGLVATASNVAEGVWIFCWRADSWIIVHDSEDRLYRVFSKLCRGLYLFEMALMSMDEAVSYIKKKTQEPKNKTTVHGYEEIIAQIGLNELTKLR